MKFIDRLSTKKFFIFNLVLLGAVFGFSLAFLSFSCSIPAKTVHAETNPAAGPAAAIVPADALAVAESLQSVLNAVAVRLLPSVVEVQVVEVRTQEAPSLQGTPWEYFFGPQAPQTDDGERQYESQGLGSGIILRRDGKTHYVLTNQHVVGEAKEITIVVNDGREFVGRLVGKDQRKDLALIAFESDEAFPLAVLGDSDALKVGDFAVAVGNPLGLVSSVTMGIISALGRTGGPADNINDFIQTDAAINQGNSGGALVNLRGEVVGINTWIASNTGGSIGLGFAIPINNAKKAIDDFIAGGSVKYGWLGVSLIDGDNDIAADMGFAGKKGAFIAQMFLDSPAEKGGMLPGDFVTSLNGKTMKDRSQLVLAVGDLMAGETAVFGLIRDGKALELKVKIDERKDAVAAENGKLWPGVLVVPLTADVREAADLSKTVKGVYAAEVVAKSPAAVMGVQRGDLILSVNGNPVDSMAAFYRAINDKSRKDLWFELQRGDTKLETMRFKR